MRERVARVRDGLAYTRAERRAPDVAEDAQTLVCCPRVGDTPDGQRASQVRASLPPRIRPQVGLNRDGRLVLWPKGNNHRLRKSIRSLRLAARRSTH